MNGRPPPRARSPPKTSLNSPARRAPGLSSSPRRAPGLSSSPLRASNVVHGSPSGAKSVQRRLEFKNNVLANKPSLKPNGVDKGKGKAVANGHLSSPEPEEEGDEPIVDEESMAILDGAEDDYAIEDEEQPDPEAEPEEEEEEGEEEEAPRPAKKSGRPKKAQAPAPPVEEEPEDDEVIASIEEDEQPKSPESVRLAKKRGRPAKNTAADDDADKQPAKKKAKRTSTAGETEGESSSQAPVKRGRKPKAATADASTSQPAKTAAPKQQKRGPKPRVSNGVGDTSVAEVPRGPPLPKSRGLVITRRETPGAGAAFTTRSGRTSYQPLKFWAGERIELDDDEVLDDGKNKIVLPHVKNIIRVDSPEPDQKTASRRRGRPATGKKSSKRRGGFADDDDDDDLEPWEEEGDVIMGEVVVWQPEHEFDPPGPDEQIEVAPDEQIAVSANAIQTREIRNATFKFAKTLSTPFFGSGVVDLPPGAEKKPKNSRKMHMTFFVFAGRVSVTVADTLFSIGRGGMFFVPRGKSP